MDQKFYQEYYKLEREGWWFKARLSILENYCQDIITNPDMKILNVGAATGATSEMLSKYGNCRNFFLSNIFKEQPVSGQLSLRMKFLKILAIFELSFFIELSFLFFLTPPTRE